LSSQKTTTHRKQPKPGPPSGFCTSPTFPSGAFSTLPARFCGVKSGLFRIRCLPHRAPRTTPPQLPAAE